MPSPSQRERLATPPILDHPLGAPTVFRPEDLVRSVRLQRGAGAVGPPEICALDFDGDLTDELVESGEARPCDGWNCFHTRMWIVDVDGRPCGLIARTVGGPFAVLAAEQLAVHGVRFVLGIASAGRVSPSMPVPGIVAVDRAWRDEGTSYHYLPPAATVDAPAGVADALEPSLREVGPPVVRGAVWTTDAPYRETAEQMERHAAAGVLAVEMQAASLFAFARARSVAVGVVAHVTNAPEQADDRFDKGPPRLQRELFRAACRGASRFLEKAP